MGTVYVPIFLFNHTPVLLRLRWVLILNSLPFSERERLRFSFILTRIRCPGQRRIFLLIITTSSWAKITRKDGLSEGKKTPEKILSSLSFDEKIIIVFTSHFHEHTNKYIFCQYFSLALNPTLQTLSLNLYFPCCLAVYSSKTSSLKPLHSELPPYFEESL